MGLGTVAVSAFGRLIVVPRWPLIFLVVGDDLRRFFRRALVLVFLLRKRADGHRAEHRYHQDFSH